MADPRLTQYIRQQMKAGFGKEQIHQALLNSGWRKEQINEAIHEITGPPKGMPALSNHPPESTSKSHFLRNVLLIIVVIVALIVALSVFLMGPMLFALGVFNPSTYTGRAATGFGELGRPMDWSYSGTNLEIMLINEAGITITVTEVSSPSCSSDTTEKTMPAGSTAAFSLTGCARKDAGDLYSEAVTVRYSAGSGITRTATGILTGTAV